MPRTSLADDLCHWIESSSKEPGAPPNLHCFRVFKDVRLPDGGKVFAVSVRHQAPMAPMGPEHFVVELWDLCRSRIQPADVGAMCLALATFRAWYSGILESAEIGGHRRRHRFSLHGNLIGEAVESTQIIDLLSQHGREVAFWTYRVGTGRAEFEPFYGEGACDARSVLSEMLDHLAWEESSDPLASEDASSNIVR
jgi:hypothetical protein